ncbi:MAG: gliding motility-associated C-terminal domain-containing protein [Breznakibacter sp.]
MRFIWLWKAVCIVLFCGTSAVAQQVTASNDIAQFYENNVVVVPVLNNDFGLESGIRSLTITSVPQYGTATVLSDNQIQYTPAYNYVGIDEFRYTVCVNSGGCASAVVYIEVMDYDFKPRANNDTIVYYNDSQAKDYVFDILANDLYLYDEPITVRLLSELEYGDVTLNGDNTVSAVFKLYFEGTDSVGYEVCDADGDCDTGVIFFQVKSGNQSGGLYVPTGISPNGDGLNDYFYIPALEYYTGIRARFFSQSGGLVFVSDNYGNNWDGRANTGPRKGETLPTGTYYYTITIPDSSFKLSGYVYISK